MTVLSNIDLEREIKKGNIRIYPLNLDSIKGSTYNLTASEYAWSLSTKKSLVDGDKIVIHSNDSALIATKEVIWVSKKICGSYHSKVSIVTAGGGHIGTTLDPEWSGHSLVTVHNHGKTDLIIRVDQTFVSIMFHYLNKKTTAFQDNTSSQLDYLKEHIPAHELNKNGANAYFDESWKKQPEKIIEKMKSDSQYEKLLEKEKKYSF